MRTTSSLRAAFAGGVVLCLALAALASGCHKQGGEGFNNTLADAQKKIGAVEKKMEDLLEFSLSKDEEQAKLKATAEEFEEAVSESRTRFDSLTVPEMESARKFHEGFDQYLKVQEEAAKHYKEIVNWRKLPAGQDAKVREALRKMRSKREQIKQQLLSLQQAYVKEEGLKLKK